MSADLPPDTPSDAHRPRHPHYEQRLHLLAALSSLPFIALLLALHFGFRPDAAASVAWFMIAFACWWGVLQLLRRQAAYPLRTVATLLEALREGDYLHRGRMDVPGDALGELIREVNLLRDTQHGQRIQVQETVALLAKVIETVDIGVFTFGPDHRLRLVNATGRALLGIEAPAMEVAGASAASFGLDELLAQDSMGVMASEFAGTRGRWQVRHRTFRESGEIHHLLVVTDLSRILREEERSAWQKLIRVLAHEINNSLVPIQSISEALEGRVRKAAAAMPEALAEDLGEGLALISGRSDALERFVKGYSSLAKLPEPRLDEVSLSELVAGVLRLEGSTRIRVEGRDLVIRADVGQLEQLLVNLLKNAREAAGDDGEVSVCWEAEDDAVRIEVIDNGPGPPPSENLFVPFFTTKPGGSGIGLVLARRIAEAHGGKLDLVAGPEGGAIARLRLPYS